MSARSKGLASLNAVVVVAMIGWNYWSAVKGLGGQTVGSMSDTYDTLFTPAGYAFSIWGFLFLGQLVHAGYQLWLAFGRGDPAQDPSLDPALARHRQRFFSQLGLWLILTNVANCLWVVLWLTEQTAASVVILATMFVFLTAAMWRLDMERWDAPLEVLGLVWWPIVFYAGWVTVAVLANLSAFLAKHDIVSGDSAAWAIGMIAVATLYNVFLILRRSMREHALVAIWALVAIAVEQWGQTPAVQWAAVGAASLLALVVAGHAFKNRKTLPLVRRLYA